MISENAALSIQKIPLNRLYVNECEPRYLDRLIHYIDLLKKYPNQYAGFLSVVPSDTWPGMFCIWDGHHRYCAYILTGRRDALCVVIKEQP